MWELRDIEIFLTVAEELHFGRAAQRLHVSSARVSQAVKKQERMVGAALFDRTTRRVLLTPVGRKLRDDLLPLYRGLHESIEQARLFASDKTRRIRVGAVPSNVLDLQPLWDAFGVAHPECHLELRSATWVDPFAALRRGDIDALVMSLPVEERDLTVGPVLFTDARMLAIAANHQLASRTSVSVEVLGDFLHNTAPRLPEYWEANFTPFHTPRGRIIERGPLVSNRDEMFATISTGAAVTMLPAHSNRYWQRPDIAWVPVHDVSRLHYALIWRTEAENAEIRALAAVAADLGTRHL
ncbi:LysR family transcriptional regulator [Nocardia concava]|uniref:LysR family transcriptional regulator n=1 Tax=Nocardia concava TaxID=257281 RepID=UPI00031E90FF|nr:LysR family transcriptional regulator [Nocardia concava]